MGYRYRVSGLRLELLYEVSYLARGVARLLRQLSYLFRHDREASSGVSRSGRLYRCVEGQKVRLVRYGVDRRYETGYLLNRRAESGHCLYAFSRLGSYLFDVAYYIRHYGNGLAGGLGGPFRRLRSLSGRLRRHRGAGRYFLYSGVGLLQCSGVVLRQCGYLLDGVTDLLHGCTALLAECGQSGGAVSYLFAFLDYPQHGLPKTFHHDGKCVYHGAERVFGPVIYGSGVYSEIAVLDLARHASDLSERKNYASEGDQHGQSDSQEGHYRYGYLYGGGPPYQGVYGLHGIEDCQGESLGGVIVEGLEPLSLPVYYGGTRFSGDHLLAHRLDRFVFFVAFGEVDLHDVLFNRSGYYHARLAEKKSMSLSQQLQLPDEIDQGVHTYVHPYHSDDLAVAVLDRHGRRYDRFVGYQVDIWLGDYHAGALLHGVGIPGSLSGVVILRHIGPRSDRQLAVFLQAEINVLHSEFSVLGQQRGHEILQGLRLL